ncbi:MAG TPA: zf-HC2 domain-containing protein [Methylomirabilota bacterium]|nr:zf-HC2 domain-containing protein [Methylomirabilota bacterium]
MLTCHEVREALEEHRRGTLPAEERAAVDAHLAGCPACRRLRDEAALLAEAVGRLPRPAAPDRLRRALEAPGRPVLRAGPVRWLGRSWVAAGLAAAVVALALSPWLRFRADTPAELVQRLLQSGVAEHRRILLQLEVEPGPVSDPTQVFARVRAVTAIPLPAVFAGADDLRLLAARPTVLADRKASAATLRYPTSPSITYFVLPGQDLPMPTDHRVQIDQYRPYMTRMGEFQVVYWKQGELAYLMVSGLDDPRTRQLFLKMRKAL